MHDAKHCTFEADSGQDEFSFHVTSAHEHLDQARLSLKELRIELDAYLRHLSEASMIIVEA